jgi:hypothetical protein
MQELESLAMKWGKPPAGMPQEAMPKGTKPPVRRDARLDRFSERVQQEKRILAHREAFPRTSECVDMTDMSSRTLWKQILLV